ncbi:MAG: winged helix DNA-binding domain-containing protein [Actinobacteria bacterium]|nr:winged helix DNA-binding domain-containing protein [Actinomycetota bacterium]
MDDRALARWRMHTLRLSGRRYPSPTATVGGLLAVQAENHPQASWAVATRTDGTVTETGFGELFDAGAILRTHVLRPTWHFVRPDDIRWLLELTAPRVRRASRQQERELGLDGTTIGAATTAIAEAIAGEGPRTRAELGARLRDRGLPGDGPAFGIVLTHAELDGLICSGPVVDGQHTNVLLADRAPDARRLDRDTARAELVLRYVTGHGPATERDLAYWASLTLTDVRAGLADVADRLDRLDHHGRTYWFTEPPPAGDPEPEPRAHLLQVLDEYHNGYQDSRGILDAGGIVPPGRQRTVGMVLVDGQMVGGMRRRVTDAEVTFELDLHRTLDANERGAVAAAADRYGAFLERSATVVG